MAIKKNISNINQVKYYETKGCVTDETWFALAPMVRQVSKLLIILVEMILIGFIIFKFMTNSASVFLFIPSVFFLLIGYNIACNLYDRKFVDKMNQNMYDKNIKDLKYTTYFTDDEIVKQDNKNKYNKVKYKDIRKIQISYNYNYIFISTMMNDIYIVFTKDLEKEKVKEIKKFIFEKQVKQISQPSEEKIKKIFKQN